jgi:hypothetical protein
MAQLQLQQLQPQLLPHLQVLQSQPPPSTAASNPPALALVVGAASTMGFMPTVAVVSMSGDILQLHALGWIIQTHSEFRHIYMYI